MPLASGTKLGPYEIHLPIGAGGMGEVYRARDERLGREVAVKILPQRVSTDGQAIGRFEQEARAVAALSHPNILALHDVGRETVDGHVVLYAVMELLEGRTLREAASARLSLRKAVDYSAQVAQGLAAAHAKGITHRDIKPENIFVTTDGHVKILDFGLAKVEERSLGADGMESTRAGGVKTDAGTVLGTTAYLSPEQAQGLPVDTRSDIFSLGTVLYELVTGARAFKGNSAIDVLHQIVYDQPAPIEQASPEAPAELKRIVTKCLAKDPDERFQSTRDLALDLKRVARELESSTSQSPLSGAGAAITPSTPIQAVPPPRRRSRMRALAIAVVFFGAIVTIVSNRSWLTRGPGTHTSDGASPAALTIERLTSIGNVIDAVISPDGKYIAYVVSENARQSLWIRQLATSSSLELVPPGPVGYWGANFNTDGSAIYYVVVTREQPLRVLYRIPTIGGTPRQILTGFDTFPVFAPDGKHFAYFRAGYPEAATSALMIADADGGGAHVLATQKAPDFFVPMFFTAPAWSPDGQTIVCPVENRGDHITGTLVAYRATDGTPMPFPHYEWEGMGQATWTPDGEGLVVVAAGTNRTTRRSSQLWWVSAKTTERRRITNDLMDYRTVSLSADGASLVTIASEGTSSIWSAPIDGSGDATRLSTGKYDGLSGLAAASGNKVLYRSLESGTPSIWSLDETTGHATQVTTNGVTSWPTPTPDGKSLLFVREDPLSLWQIGQDGQNARQIPGPRSVLSSTMTPDGKWIVFVSQESGQEEVWKMPATGGTPTRLIDGHADRPSISPDGTQIAAYYQPDLASSWRLAVFPITGGPPTKTFPNAAAIAWATVRWTADGKAILHNAAPGDRTNIWLQPLDGSPARRVTHFVDQNIMGFDRSADGKRLIIARGVLLRDAMLMRNFR